MAVYVAPLRRYDDERIAPIARRHGPWWSYMTADTDEELHGFATLLSLPRNWAHNEADPDQGMHHYDLTASRHHNALERGATQRDDLPHVDHLFGDYT